MPKRASQSSPTQRSSKKLKTNAGMTQQSLGMPSSIPSPPSPTNSIPDSNESAWTKVDQRGKKARKQAARVATNTPRFLYNPTELGKRREPVTISELRDLVLHLLGDATAPSWLKIENRSSIKKVVVLLVPGLTTSHLSSPTEPAEELKAFIPLTIPKETPALPFLATFMHVCPTKAPGEHSKMHSVLTAFFMGPVSGEEKKRRILKRIEDERDAKRDAAFYVLTSEQMLENEYPMPSYLANTFEMPPDWVESPCPTENSPYKVIAMDCEMCMTAKGKELTRITLIDFDTDQVIYDTLVKPIKPITDYLTRFSGITPEKLASVTTCLTDVHAALKTLIPPNAILLGHSLESDLKALKLCHGRCIDTSVIYHHPRGKPLKPGLAWLTKKWVGREIQHRGEGGHDSEEDARACISLLRMKIQNGSGFGEFKVDHESILERLSRHDDSIKTAVVDYGNPSTWHGAKASTAIACQSDEEVTQNMCDALPNHQFIFGRMIKLSEALGWTTPKSNVSDAPPSTPIAESSILETLDANLTTLYTALPPRTAFILFTGHSDPRSMAQLGQRKSRWDQLIREGKSPSEIPREEWWSAQEGRLLEDECEKAKKGMLFLCLKPLE